MAAKKAKKGQYAKGVSVVGNVTCSDLVSFTGLAIGEFFIFRKKLWMKVGDYDQEAFCFDDRAMESDMCDHGVSFRPVDVDICWNYR